jgi:hypothetical protein
VYNPAGIMLVNLRALFSSVVDIILFRRGPENLPASQTLLAIVVALSILVMVVMTVLSSLPAGSALLEAALRSPVTLIWYFAALALANKRERAQQTLTAIFGVRALFHLLKIPLAAALIPYAIMVKADPTTPPPAALSLIALLVWVWALIVNVRITRAAFECPSFVAILLVVGEFFAFFFIISLLFGLPVQGVA